MNPELLLLIESEYGLPAIESSEKVEKGVLSENWFVTAGGQRYFLKKYRFDDENRIKEIHAAKQFFADSDIPVILPISLRGGATYVANDREYYALFPYIEARQLWRGNFTDTAIQSMGRMLGRIHAAGKESTFDIKKEGFKPWNHQEFEVQAYAYIAQIREIPEPTPFDALALEDLKLKLSLVGEYSQQYPELDLAYDHLIHGDYLDHNLFFDAADEVSHVFDFEKSQYAPRSYELVRSLLYCIMDPDTEPESIRRARLYVEAYQSIYPISQHEFAQGIELFFLKSVRALWMQKELYMLKNRRPEQFLAADMARTRFLVKHRSGLADVLI